jgi:crotonobetainyl-CoA:carnitine CoA-transferase CaiB-like acyl-CoA transferase
MQALTGIRILSFNHFLMGPVGIQFLADLGADVIGIEPIEGAFQRKWGGLGSRTVDGQTSLFLAGGRNKRSIAVNLKDPRALALVKKLIATADVVAENYRPGVMDSLGIGYEACKALKGDIVYAAGSGFGPDGPYVDRPGQDLIIQAMSGIAAITGTREHGPRAVGVSAVDHHGAALFAAGILAALLRRQRSGEGARVDVSLLSAAIHLQTESFTNFLNLDREADIRQPYPSAGWYFEAPYGIYATADGFLAVSLAPLDVLQELIGVPEGDRVANADNFNRREDAMRAVAAALARHDTAHWTALFLKHKIWHSQVNDYRAVVDDPQVRHNRSFVAVDGATGSPVTLVGHPVLYDGKAPEPRLPPQKLGAQTRDVLRELGCSPGEIEDLVAAGAVAVAGDEARPA